MSNEIEPISEETGQGWALARQWQLAWRTLKWSFFALVAFSFMLVIGQGFLFYRVFADIHPVLGGLFILLLAGLLGVLVGRPILSFFRTPVMATAPEWKEGMDMRVGLRERLKYDLDYLKAMSRNPLLAVDRASILQDIEAGRALLATVLDAEEAVLADLKQTVIVFEQERIEARLAGIDVQVDRLIHAEAVGVGAATAISMNGTLDAFIVLWRNANLVSKIAELYFGRPSLRGSLLILRDVAMIVVASRALDDATDIAGEVIGGLLGRMGGLIAGPVMDGAINSMMTLKLGYLAKRRCRSFQGWRADQAPSISAAALQRVKTESVSVASELLKRCGGLTATAARATESVVSGSKNAWALVRSWFGGEKPGPVVE